MNQLEPENKIMITYGRYQLDDTGIRQQNSSDSDYLFQWRNLGYVFSVPERTDGNVFQYNTEFYFAGGDFLGPFILECVHGTYQAPAFAELLGFIKKLDSCQAVFSAKTNFIRQWAPKLAGLQKAAEDFQKSPDLDSALKLGKLAWVSLDYELAETAFNKVLEIAPDNLDAKEAMAKIYLETDRELQAEPLLEQLLDVDPENPVYVRDVTQYYLLNDNDKVISSAEKLFELDQLEVEMRVELAKWYLVNLKFEEGVTILKSLHNSEFPEPVQKLAEKEIHQIDSLTQMGPIGKSMVALILKIAASWMSSRSRKYRKTEIK